MNIYTDITRYSPDKLRCSPGRRADGSFTPAHFKPRDEALRLPLVGLQFLKKWYIAVDIDRKSAAYDWFDLVGAPQPNWVISGSNGHAHWLYTLAEPVCFPSLKKAGRNVRRPKCLSGAAKLYNAVQKALTKAVGGDPAFNGLMIKNPLVDCWKTVCARSGPYTLDELAGYLDIEPSQTESPALPDVDVELPETVLDRGVDVWNRVGSRHAYRYNMLRRLAFAHMHRVASTRGFDYAMSVEELTDFLTEQANRINDAADEPGRWCDVMADVRSVARWCRLHFDPRCREDSKNRGIMGLDPELSIHERQSMGAFYTAGLRRDRSGLRLHDQIRAMLADGLDVTCATLVKLRLVAKSTIYARAKDIARWVAEFTGRKVRVVGKRDALCRKAEQTRPKVTRIKRKAQAMDETDVSDDTTPVTAKDVLNAFKRADLAARDNAQVDDDLDDIVHRLKLARGKAQREQSPLVQAMRAHRRRKQHQGQDNTQAASLRDNRTNDQASKSASRLLSDCRSAMTDQEKFDDFVNWLNADSVTGQSSLPPGLQRKERETEALRAKSTPESGGLIPTKPDLLRLGGPEATEVIAPVTPSQPEQFTEVVYRGRAGPVTDKSYARFCHDLGTSPEVSLSAGYVYFRFALEYRESLRWVEMLDEYMGMLRLERQSSVPAGEVTQALGRPLNSAMGGRFLYDNPWREETSDGESSYAPTTSVT